MLLLLIGMILLICIVIWAVRSLLAAFAVGEPLSTVIMVVVVLLCLVMFLDQTGALGGLHLGGSLR